MKLKDLFHTLLLLLVINAPLLGRVMRHFGKPKGRTQAGSKKEDWLFLSLAVK